MLYLDFIITQGKRKQQYKAISQKVNEYAPQVLFQENYSNDKAYQRNNNKNKINVTFLLIGNNKIGVDVPYKVFNSDNELKTIIKSNQATWDKDQRMWVLSHKNYQNMLDQIIEHCRNKQYYCAKVPSFVYDAQLDMPSELLVKISRLNQIPMIKYLEVQTYIDPQTLPFYDKLYDFQKQSLKFGIEHHGRMLLADEMGVGKTIQSLAIAFMYRHEWPMVIICPSTLRFNWLNQILFWYGQYIRKNQIQIYVKGGLTLKQNTKILIISYELAWKFKQLWSDFKVAIVDQAHYLKNSGCKRTDILVPQLARKKRIILLTGTPAFARPRQIFNLASIIRPDVFHNFTQFGNRYCQPSRNPWSGHIEYNGCINSKQLFYLLKDKVMLRRLKKDVLTQLPDKQRQKIVVQTNKAIVKQINQLMQLGDNHNKQPQDLIMKMFGLKNSGQERAQENKDHRQSIMQAYRLSGAAKIDGVVQYILSLLQNDVKLLIFAHHRVILDRIQNQLNSKKYKSIRIDGQVDHQKRQQRVVTFQNNKDVMAALLSISAAGVGLTLTASSTVVFAELHWTPGMLIQAEDRAHRIGQKNCVNCHYLIGQGTLDNMLYNYLLRKINNVSTFVDGTEQILQIQQLQKGEMGKVSKKNQSDRKINKFQPDARQSFKIKPIRLLGMIRDEQKMKKQEQNSQATDIQSLITNNPFKATENQEDTASLESRKKKSYNFHLQQNSDQQLSPSSRIKSKLKVIIGRVSENFSQNDSTDNKKINQIIDFIDSLQDQKDKKHNNQRIITQAKDIKKQNGKSKVNKCLKSTQISNISADKKQNRIQIDDKTQNTDTDIDITPTK